MKVRHYSTFNNTNKELVWENLRNDETENHYFIPFDREEYLQKVSFKTISDTAQNIINEVDKLGLKKIFSVGSGIASLEYQVKNQSDIAVTISDYNKSVLRLRDFKIFDDALLFNAFSDPLPGTRDYILLFPRIDTEFDNDQLETLFKKSSEAGIDNIIFIPANILFYIGLLA
jgi:hypothetical protein